MATFKEMLYKTMETVNTKSICYLYDRWQDEKEYEDWKDYEIKLKKSIPIRGKFIKTTKKPFAVWFELYEYEVRLIATAKYAEWDARLKN